MVPTRRPTTRLPDRPDPVEGEGRLGSTPPVLGSPSLNEGKELRVPRFTGETPSHSRTVVPEDNEIRGGGSE